MTRRIRTRGRARPDFRGRQKRSGLQLLMALGALIMLLAFWRQLSDGAAGCYYGITTDGSAQKAPPAEPAATPENQPIKVIRRSAPDTGTPAD